MYRDKNGHAQSANAMQNVGQKRTLSLVAQGCRKADIPFQAHSCLLWSLFSCKDAIISSIFPSIKVTILMDDSFQTSSKKMLIDLYNPNSFGANALILTQISVPGAFAEVSCA